MKKSYLLGLLLLLSFILCACSSKNSDVKQTVTVTPEVTKAPSEELTVEPTEELDTVEKTVDYLSLTDSELLSLSAEEDVDFTYCVKTVNKKGAGIGLAIRGIEKNAVLSFAGLEALYDYSIIVFPTKIEGASLPVNVTNAIFALSKNRGSDSYSYSTDEESEYAFCEDFDDLKLVVIPSTVYLIDDGYFVDCKNLERVVLGSNVNEIGASAFQGCASLKTINFPKNLEVIASSAFDDCDSLENIVVVKNSYGEDYCKENNLPYSYIDGSLPSGAQESEQVIDMTEESLSEIWCGKYDMQNSEGNWTFTVDYVTSSWDGSFGILLWDIYNEDTDEGFYKKTHQMEFGLSDDGLSINYYDGYFTMVLDTNTNSITLDADDDTISGVYTRVD